MSATHSQALSIPLLIHLLRHKTVTQVSFRLAAQAQTSGDYSTAARLYVQCGRLSDAIVEAHMAATALLSNHRHESALAVLKNVTRYAELTNTLFDARNLLMLSGDILKQTGQADDAMTKPGEAGESAQCCPHLDSRYVYDQHEDEVI